jgi:arsenical pump membrane protein
MMAHMLTGWIIATLGVLVVSLFFSPTIRVQKVTVQSYWLIAMIGALGVLMTEHAPGEFLLTAILGDGAINPLRILALFFSFTILATYLDEVGFIRYLAYRAMHYAGVSQRQLFVIWYACIALATIVTANDIVILTLTPFIIYFSRHSRISPMPYLVSQFVAANTWSMLLIIGNPTNIYLASMFDIGFLEYVQIMFIPTVLTGGASFLILFGIFDRQLTRPLSRPEMIVNPPHPSYRIGLWMLIVAIGLMILAKPLQVGMDQVTILSALIMVMVVAIRYPKQPYLQSTFRHLPYALMPFMLSMAVLVAAMNQLGWTMMLMQYLRPFNPIYSYGISSFLFSNAMNNIPMSLWFADIIQLNNQHVMPMVYATIIGSNLGALLTPIGALAGLMWLHILKDKQVQFGLLRFLGYGLMMGTSLITMALLALDVISP